MTGGESRIIGAGSHIRHVLPEIDRSIRPAETRTHRPFFGTERDQATINRRQEYALDAIGRNIRSGRKAAAVEIGYAPAREVLRRPERRLTYLGIEAPLLLTRFRIERKDKIAGRTKIDQTSDLQRRDFIRRFDRIAFFPQVAGPESPCDL